MRTFLEGKNDFDLKYISMLEFEAFLPVDTVVNKKVKIKGSSGNQMKSIISGNFSIV